MGMAHENKINQDIQIPIDEASKIAQAHETKTETIKKDKIVVYEKWEDYDLKEELLRGLFAMGFDHPSYIQKTSIMPIISGKDVRAQAQSGTGKTGAFAVAALQTLRPSNGKAQILIVVNTLEIAKQNFDRVLDFGQFMEFKIALLVAGIPMDQNRHELRNGVDIVVGTPGRINHMIRDGHFDASGVRLFIVDEADEMLKSEFKDQMRSIFAAFNFDILKSALFSATWEEDALEMSKQILENPITIDLRQDELTLKGIEQYLVNIGSRPLDKDAADDIKIACLQKILTTRSVGQCIVFVQSKRKTEKVFMKIKDAVSFPVAMITGDMSPADRASSVKGVANGTTRVLISTPVTSRGIDIPHLSVVINMDIPRLDDKSSYIHRIGRAGRYGRKGKAINIIFADEVSIIEDLKTHYQTTIDQMPGDLEL